MLSTLLIRIFVSKSVTIMKHLFIILFLLCGLSAFAQPKVNDKPATSTDFPLCANGKPCDIYISSEDFEVVKKTAALFAEDIARVTGVKGQVSVENPTKGKNIVVIGTLGHNRFIDEMVKQKKLDVSAIRHGWEQYVLKTINQPTENIDRVLIIAGCDRRERHTERLPYRKRWECLRFIGGRMSP